MTKEALPRLRKRVGMRNPHDVLIKPLVSEKSMSLMAEKQISIYRKQRCQ
jgi:hypothetical protein